MKKRFIKPRCIGWRLFALAFGFGFLVVIQAPVVLAVDTLVTSVYIDADGDGNVDHIKLTFDENIGLCSYEASDWTVNTAGSINVSITGINIADPEGTGEGDCDGTDAVIYVSINADANETGGAIDPVISYTNQGTLNGLRDSDTISDKPNITASDAAGPIITDIQIEDTDADGLIDKLVFTWSEFVDTDDSIAPVIADFETLTLSDGQAVTAATISDPAGASNTVTLTAIADQVTFNTAAGSTGISGDLSQEWVDGASNTPHASGGSGNETVTDAAAPYLKTATYSDSDANGTIDTVALAFSELTTVTMAGAEWEFSTAGDVNLEGDFLIMDCHEGEFPIPQLITTCTDDDNSTVTADANKTGKQTAGGAEPAWTYTNSGNNRVTDGTNHTGTFTKTLIDGAAPIVQSSTLNYASGLLGMTFSEFMDASATDVVEIHVNDATGADAPLTGATVTDVDGITVNVTLTADQRETLRATSGISGGDGGANVLDLDAAAVADLLANANVLKDNTAITESTAASLDAGLVILTNTTENQVTGFDISFTNVNPIPANGKIQVVFPATINVLGAAGQTATNLSGVNGTLTASVSGGIMTLTRSGGTETATGTSVAFRIAGGLNGAAGQTGSFTLRTLDAADNTRDTGTAPSRTIAAQVTTTTTGGGGGGGGGGGSGGGYFIPSTSNTATSHIASTFTQTVSTSKVYSRPIQLVSYMILNDVDRNMKFAHLTDETGEFTLKPNKDSTVMVKFPPNTKLEANPEWDGIIDPPILRTYLKVPKLGGTIVGSNLKLERENVYEVIEVGSRKSPLMFNQNITVEAPIENADGTNVAIYASPDSREWTKIGESVIENGKVIFTTTHFSFFAVEHMGDGTDPEELRPAAPRQFADIVSHWAETYIKRITDMGIVSGKTATRFAPDDAITRAELVKIAINAFGFPLPETVESESYRDVALTAWYAPYIQTAKENGMIQAARDFRPNDTVNRAEAMKILIEAAGFEDVFEVYQSNFTSKPGWTYITFPDALIDQWYARYVAYAVVNGIVSGYPDNTFRPGNSITRAEVAKVVTKILDLLD